MIKKILQLFSFIGAIFGLLILIYLPFIFWFVIFSLFFIFWGLISFLYCSETSKYKIVLRIFSFTGLALAIFFIIFSLWGFISLGLSVIMRNFLIISFVLGIFTFTWSFLALRCTKLVNKKLLNKKR
jgi:hypothetical protein